MKHITTLFILFGVFFSSLQSLEVKKKTYFTENSPGKNYKEYFGNYYTEISYKDWPKNRIVDVFEQRLTYPKERKVSCLEAGSCLTLVVGSLGYYPGETTILTFKDKTLTESTQIIPNPICAESLVDNAHIYAVLENFSSFNIVLTGFKKNEKLILEFSSYDETIHHTLSFVEDMKIGYLPQVVGKQGGISKISIERASGEILTMDIPWGEEMLKHCLYYDKNGHVVSILKDKEDW